MKRYRMTVTSATHVIFGLLLLLITCMYIMCIPYYITSCVRLIGYQGLTEESSNPSQDIQCDDDCDTDGRIVNIPEEITRAQEQQELEFKDWYFTQEIGATQLIENVDKYCTKRFFHGCPKPYWQSLQPDSN